MKKLEYLIRQVDKTIETVFKEAIDNREAEWNYSDASVIGFLQNLRALGASIFLLQDNESYAGIESLIRVSFENYVFLKYILQKDSLNRATAYILSDVKFQKKYYDILIQQGKTGREIRELLSVTIDEISEGAGNLTNPEYIERLNDRYASCFGGRIPKIWYNFDNKTNNFEQLCNKMGDSAMYNILYRLFSRETHSAKVNDMFSYEKNMVTLNPPYISDEMTESAICLFLIESIRKVYKYYELKDSLITFNFNLKIKYTHNNF